MRLAVKPSGRWLEIPTTVKHVGIYLLISNGVVVYVGRSTDIAQRARSHNRHLNPRRGRRRWVFDEARWMPVAPENLRVCEGDLIRLLAPKYNTIFPGGSAPPDLEHIAKVLGVDVQDLFV